jgi:GNAT superfamily N-acetyltransferase
MLKIEPLSRQHRRNDFDCGVPALNGYLAKIAFQHNEKGLSKTFVAIENISPEIIIGFFTLSVSEIDCTILPDKLAKKLPDHRLPIIKLARLAVNKSHHGQKIGRALLFEALTRAYEVYQTVGAVALVVDAKDETAAGFYRKYGFIPAPSNSLQLFRPFRDVAEALAINSA